MKAIFEREINSYFNNITGYIFSAFVLLFAGIYTMTTCLKDGYPNFEYVLGAMTFIFLVVTPIITMRVIAEEKRQKTDQLLYALPLSMTKVVLGKYFAMLAVLGLPIIIMAVYPLIISTLGNVSLIGAYGTLIAFFFLGAALIAIGTFISSLTESQAVAAGLCLVVMLIIFFISSLANYLSTSTLSSLAALAVLILILGLIVWLLTHNRIFSLILTVALEAILVICYSIWETSFFGLFPKIISQFSLFDRFNLFITGIFDVTTIIYYISVTVLFLFLTIQSMEKRRWS
jgi:ABC-2 type transport system permease protein